MVVLVKRQESRRIEEEEKEKEKEDGDKRKDKKTNE